jgi:hypothetical protein
MKRDTRPGIEMASDGKELTVTLHKPGHRLDGKVIAKRGQPGTRHAGTWIPLEPGVAVSSPPDLSYIAVEIDGVAIH